MDTRLTWLASGLMVLVASLFENAPFLSDQVWPRVPKQFKVLVIAALSLGVAYGVQLAACNVVLCKDEVTALFEVTINGLTAFASSQGLYLLDSVKKNLSVNLD